MLDPNVAWAFCYADIEEGIAVFDGLVMRADSVNDPRWNRVLPIMEEEQVLMSRHMVPLLRPGLRVLDVGTGSGVFAILAARHGCEVVAIDPSARALAVARENTMQNRESGRDAGVLVRAVDHQDALEAGAICYQQVGLEQYVSERMPAGFDMVILAPPYNPTCRVVAPPLHARAGKRGQLMFRNQICHVPELLKPDGGICVGNQMSIADQHGNVEALRRIERAFSGHNCQILYSRMLPYADEDRKHVNSPSLNDVEIHEFLERQYHGHLQRENSSAEYPGPVRQYVDEIGRSGYFSLVYYEVHAGTRVVPAEPQCITLGADALPRRYWRDRIDLHRRIVDNTSPLSSYPASAAFFRGTVDLPRPRNGGGASPTTDQANGDASFPPLSEALSAIRQWVSDQEIIGGDDGFDVLFIDTAPWYRQLTGLGALYEECHLWAPPSANKETCEAMLAEWQQVTRCLQAAYRAPFFHPHFTGDNAREEWRGLHCRTLWDHQPRLPEALASLLPVYEKAVEDQWARFASRLPSGGLLEDLRSIGMEFWGQSGGGTGYSRTLLTKLNERLSDGNYAEQYREDLERRVRAIVQDYDVSERIPAFVSADISMEQATARDLELCHTAMHRRVRQCFGRHGIVQQNWSTLIGVPITLTGSHEVPDRDRPNIPGTYRGGVWIYTSASAMWTLRHEQLLLDLSRLAWLLYNGKYNLDATLAQVEQEKQFALSELRRNSITGVAHAMRQPISSAITELKLLRRDHPEAPSTDRVEKLCRAGVEFFNLVRLADRFGEEGREAWAIVASPPQNSSFEPHDLSEDRLTDILRDVAAFVVYSPLRPDAVDVAEAVLQDPGSCVYWDAPARLGLVAVRNGAPCGRPEPAYAPALTAVLWELLTNSVQHGTTDLVPAIDPLRLSISPGGQTLNIVIENCAFAPSERLEGDLTKGARMQGVTFAGRIVHHLGGTTLAEPVGDRVQRITIGLPLAAAGRKPPDESDGCR